MPRVLIVSSNRLYREGLMQMLAQRDGFVVVGATCDRAQTVEVAREVQPNVVLLDLSTPGTEGVTHDLKNRVPGVPIVALGVADAEREVLSCVEAGMAGYVGRDGSLDDVVAAVADAASGELHCSPKIAGSLMRRVAVLAAAHVAAPPRIRLTSREREVVDLLEKDFSNKEIATALCIEVATVKNHVHNLLEKLNVHKRSHVAAVANLAGSGSST